MLLGMNNKMLELFLKSQLKNLKKVRVEWSSEKNQSKNLYRIKDQNIHSGEAYLTLEDIKTGEISHLHFKLPKPTTDPEY